MPPPAYAHLKQTALLWEKSGSDEYNEPRVGPPEEVRCRWENRQTVMRSPAGEPMTVDATVVMVDDVELGSIMFEGGFDDVPGTGTGTANVPEDGLMEIVTFETMYDLRGVVLSRRYGLVFFRDTFPEIA